MDPSEQASLIENAFLAFPDPVIDADASRVALKTVANILLLHKEARQVFVDLDYVGAVADRLRVVGNNREDEIICSRLLFLLTYDTNADFEYLFERHWLSSSIEHNISFHASRYSNEHREEEGASLKPHLPAQQSTADRALTESLKLLFNLTQFYPKRTPEFSKTIPPILIILCRIPLHKPVFQPPVTHLIHALLNLDLQGEQGSGQKEPSADLFPNESRALYTERLIAILEAGLSSEGDVDGLESAATPLVSVLRRINAIAPPPVQAVMREELLPTKDDRSQPLGKSDTLPSRLLRLSTSPSSPNLKEAISSLLFELSDRDAITFVRNVGYGYAAGFLMTHKVDLSGTAFDAANGGATHVDGQEVNPITGQRRDMEPEMREAEMTDDEKEREAEMTDDEKEREAERLFVLFERLKATGVVNVTNPVELAQREGRFEEVDE